MVKPKERICDICGDRAEKDVSNERIYYSIRVRAKGRWYSWHESQRVNRKVDLCPTCMRNLCMYAKEKTDA